MQHWDIISTGLPPRSLMMPASRIHGEIGIDSYTKLLLHMDGADTSTTFTDSSLSAHTATANGNAQIDTAQSKFGGASGLFDGTDDYLNLDGHADFAFGTADFTVDFWVQLNATGIQQAFYDSRPSGANGLYSWLGVTSGNVLFYHANSGTRITGTTALGTGAWYHIALARSGTSTKLFLDGTQEGSTYSDSNNYIVGASRPTLATNGNSVTTNELNGWLDEVRVSKGIARWTANFTPPIEAYI